MVEIEEYITICFIKNFYQVKFLSKNSLEKLHVEFDIFEIVWGKIILDGVSENYMNKHQK